MRLVKTLTAALLAGAAVTTANAHDGRRMEIKVVGGQLVGQGYISNGVDDGGGTTRTYVNAIHGHWHFNDAPGVTAASADLPGFDLFGGSELTGFGVTATLVDGYRWVNPPVEPTPGTVPVFEALGVQQAVYVSYEGDVASTDDPGPVVLFEHASAAGVLDIDPSYDVADEPTGQLMVLEFVLSTDAPGVADSRTVYVILSPDGADPTEKLHHASLYLESYLGTPVEPSADVTGDGSLNNTDINVFVNLFLAGAPAADLNGDGSLNNTDINLFVNLFIAG